MADDMKDLLANLVRIGTVSSVESTKGRARVIFKDKAMVSGWLYVLQQTSSGAVSWMPRVNDRVLCLYLPIFNGDGFILGAIV
jgi:phage baseplate assembly protein gpV